MLTRDPAVAAALIQALGARRAGVRRMAAALLGQTSSPAAGGALVAALADEDAGVRVAALDAIATLGGDAHVAAAAGRAWRTRSRASGRRRCGR